MDKAVILAAGLGNRISKLSSTPKPFLSLDGTPTGPTFVDWHLDQLAAAGVKELYLVGNTTTIQREFAPRPGATLTKILNPTQDLSTSGSGHSTWFAFLSEHNILDGKSRVILMDADILYEPAVFERLKGPSAKSRTLVCQRYRESNEEVMVFGRGREALVHGKGLLGTGLVDHLETMGEATGILLWEPGDHAMLRSATEWCIKYSTAKTRSEHEDITQRMMLAGKVDAEVFDDLLFMECDTPEEYAVLIEEFYPSVLKKRATV